MKKISVLCAALLSMTMGASAKDDLSKEMLTRISNYICNNDKTLDDFVYMLHDVDKDGLKEVFVKEKVREYNNYWVFSQAKGVDEPLMERETGAYSDFSYSEDGFLSTTVEASTYNYTSWIKLEKSKVKYIATASETHEDIFDEDGEWQDVKMENSYTVMAGDKQIGNTEKAYAKYSGKGAPTSLYNLDEWQSFPSTGKKGRLNQLQESGRVDNELVPVTWSSQIVRGDLNGDGLADVVVLATPDDPAHIEKRSDGFTINMNEPVLGIYFCNENYFYHLYKQYTGVVPPLDEMMGGGGSVDITDKGVLKIRIEDGDPATDASYTSLLYRFQNGDFYLIGRGDYEFDRMDTHNTYVTTYNYNTGKVQHKVIVDSGRAPKDRWETLPKAPLKKLGEEVEGL